MTIGLAPKTSYTIGAFAIGTVAAFIAMKATKGHIYWLCLGGVGLASAVIGYSIGSKKEKTVSMDSLGDKHLPNWGTQVPDKEVITSGWGTPIHQAPESEMAKGTY